MFGKYHIYKLPKKPGQQELHLQLNLVSTTCYIDILPEFLGSWLLLGVSWVALDPIGLGVLCGRKAKERCQDDTPGKML